MEMNKITNVYPSKSLFKEIGKRQVPLYSGYIIIRNKLQVTGFDLRERDLSDPAYAEYIKRVVMDNNMDQRMASVDMRTNLKPRSDMNFVSPKHS